MGMAASQARLLAITARIHDVEYQAQSLQNAKLQLATQSDQVYDDYLEALNSSTLVLNKLSPDGTKSLITANFNTLFSKNKACPADGSTYALRNNQGKLVVEDEVFQAYQQFRKSGLNDAYAFAIYMMNNGNIGHLGNLQDETSANNFQKALQAEEENAYKALNGGNGQLKELHDALVKDCADGKDIYSGPKPGIDPESYQTRLTQYRHALYKQNGEGVYKQANEGEDGYFQAYNQDYLEHYMNVFRQIQTAGGCVPISDYNGLNGDAANNSDWLQAMIQCGKLTIDVVKENKTNNALQFTTTSPGSDTSLSYVDTGSVDKTAIAKAEAKYEHDMKQINQKDKQYDLTLSKLETERTALTTEYDSVKKVIEDNIERTFGIFS